ncbi:hypothetical protein F4819DRAFT_153492 [Hypoxylon fuscum]|nr:hypothetical protein F4819DRAFT_153492 [Hypoxylon fuscum]
MRRRPASESSLRKSSGGWWTTFARYPGSNRSSVAAFLFLGLFYELMTFLFVVAMTIVVTIFILTGATTIVVFVWMMRMRMGLLLMGASTCSNCMRTPSCPACRPAAHVLFFPFKVPSGGATHKRFQVTPTQLRYLLLKSNFFSAWMERFSKTSACASALLLHFSTSAPSTSPVG